MDAIALTVTVFIFALILGLGLTAACRRRELHVRDVLLAPAIGFAVEIVLVVPLNRVGLPIRSFAEILTVVLMIAAVASIVRFRNFVRKPLRASAPFGIIAIVGLVLTASPMFSFGLDWFSYSNGDAINYSMSAERLGEDGLYTPPLRANYLADRDVPRSYFFLNGASTERVGADELLAFTATLFRLNPLRCIMATLVALHLTGMLALGALLYQGRFGKWKAIAGCSMLGLSALATFGVEYQLLGQVVGLVFLTVALAQLCTPSITGFVETMRAGGWVLPAVVMSALCEGYPEMLPFALIAIAVFYAVVRPVTVRIGAVYFGIGALAVALILNTYLRITLFVLASRLGTNAGDQGRGLFPYYLLPTGVPNLFGLTPVAAFPKEPWLSIEIAAGLAACVVLIAAAVRGLRDREPAAYLLVVYCAVFGVFFSHHEGFALYKLAMYMQPAIVGVLSTAAVVAIAQTRFRWRRVILAIPFVTFLLLNVLTQQFYVASSRASTDARAGSFIEIPSVSDSHLLEQLARLRTMIKPGSVVISDTFNKSLSGIESFYTRELAAISFPEQDTQHLSPLSFRTGSLPFSDPSQESLARSLISDRSKRFSKHAFSDGSISTEFEIDGQEKLAGSTLWLHGAKESPFNRTKLKDDEIEVNPMKSNILAFVSSTAGRPYFTQYVDPSLFQLEPDIFFPQSTMSAIGRYLLFEVLRPKAPFRVRIAFTETLRQDGANVVPAISVVGRTRAYFPNTGRGSADIVSGYVVPQVIAGHSYIMLDMGVKPSRFVSPKTGLMLLWGRDVAVDRRLLTAFLRDISVVEPDYETKAQSVTVFPRDLQHPSVEYSGIYEDGWASDDVSIRLNVGSAGVVHLRGVVPQIQNSAFETIVSSYVDGFPAGSVRLSVGDADVAVMTGAGVHRIEWRFSRFQILPGADQRPATLQIRSIM